MQAHTLPQEGSVNTIFSSSQGPANGAILLLLVWHWIGGCNWQHGEIMVLRMK